MKNELNLGALPFGSDRTKCGRNYEPNSFFVQSILPDRYIYRVASDVKRKPIKRRIS